MVGAQQPSHPNEASVQGGEARAAQERHGQLHLSPQRTEQIDPIWIGFETAGEPHSFAISTTLLSDELLDEVHRELHVKVDTSPKEQTSSAAEIVQLLDELTLQQYA